MEKTYILSARTPNGLCGEPFYMDTYVCEPENLIYAKRKFSLKYGVELDMISVKEISEVNE